MSYRKSPSLVALTLLIGLSAPMLGTLDRYQSQVLAQSEPSVTFPLPTSVPADTKLMIDSSTSMKAINQTLEDGFEKAYSGTGVTVNYSNTDAALQAVESGKSDIAAIGRNLTPAEKEKGLKEVVITRHKIAAITSPDNPFVGSLTIQQFSDIFHGQIKSWSEVGGPAEAIVFVDRPETSDTRAAFQNYEVFQKEPFKTGDNAVITSADTIEAVVEKLGKNGISFAVIDLVANNPQVKVIKMHDTLPDDPRYPFSQSLVYVYKGTEPSEAVKAFLGFATSPDKQTAIEAARQVDAGVAPTPAASPETTAQAPAATTTENQGGGLPGWLWWLLPLAALIAIPFLLKGRDTESVTEPSIRPVAPPEPITPVAPLPVVPPAVVGEKSRIILVPRDCKSAYAYWEVSDEDKAALRRQGGEKMVLRLYDVTDIELDQQAAHWMQEYDCRELDPDLHVTIPTDDRDYLVELGYVTPEGNWLKLVRSHFVRVPACPPFQETLSTAQGVIGDVKETVTQGIAAVPGVFNDALSNAQGVIGDVKETVVQGLANAPDVLGETKESLSTGAAAVIAGATGLAAAGAAAAHAWLTRDDQEAVETEEIIEEAVITPQERIIYVPRDKDSAYVYWEVSAAAKEFVRRQGGRNLALRICDLTDTNDDGTPDSIWQYDVAESDQDKQVPIHAYERNYIAELGYLTEENQWIAIARSQPVFIPTPPVISE
jgi:phosphate transport system substrate-binding protein